MFGVNISYGLKRSQVSMAILFPHYYDIFYSKCSEVSKAFFRSTVFAIKNQSPKVNRFTLCFRSGSFLSAELTHLAGNLSHHQSRQKLDDITSDDNPAG